MARSANEIETFSNQSESGSTNLENKFDFMPFFWVTWGHLNLEFSFKSSFRLGKSLTGTYSNLRNMIIHEFLWIFMNFSDYQMA